MYYTPDAPRISPHAPGEGKDRRSTAQPAGRRGCDSGPPRSDLAAAGKHRIRVNAIAPGLVLTADIASLALFLAADESPMITKQTFGVNGGSA